MRDSVSKSVLMYIRVCIRVNISELECQRAGRHLCVRVCITEGKFPIVTETV